MGDPVPTANLYALAVVDNDKPGDTVQVVVQGVAFSPMKPLDISGSTIGKWTDRIVENGHSRLSIGKRSKHVGAGLFGNGHFMVD